jgi:hypothetical protein
MKKRETKKKRFKKPRILREMDIETRAGYCGTSPPAKSFPPCTVQYS